MDNYYVTPDGTIAKLPQRSLFDRLTSGLYDASVEYRKPGGGQEARIGRNQSLTSALNRYGEQKRSFGQEDSVLNRTQAFTAEQDRIKRDENWALADFAAGQQAERDRLKREQDAAQFAATQGLAAQAENRLQLGQNLRGWDTAKQFMFEQPKIASEIEWNKARAGAESAQQKLYEARAAAEGQKITPEELALLSAINPKLTSAIIANPGLTNSTMNALGTILRAREGTSGQLDPALLQQLLGGESALPTTQPRGTNAATRVKL
jgi:hypothetical protein